MNAAATIKGILDTISATILGPVVYILVIAATAVFIWGLIKFLTSAHDDKKAGEGKQLIIWGVVGLFAIVAMWGLVLVLQNTFHLDEERIPSPSDLPQ